MRWYYNCVLLNAYFNPLLRYKNHLNLQKHKPMDDCKPEFTETRHFYLSVTPPYYSGCHCFCRSNNSYLKYNADFGYYFSSNLMRGDKWDVILMGPTR